MDETTRTAPAARTGTDDVDHVADQPALPLELSYDDGIDEPIGYSLTARARRHVAPDALPSLRVVGEPPSVDGRPDHEPDGDLERPGDTRPSRARALRRAGVTTRDIATQLDVDELVVRAWVGDVPVARARPPARGSAVRSVRPRSGSGEPRQVPATADVTDDRRLGFELARAAAADEVRPRLQDAGFAAGLGVISGILNADEHAATLATARLEVAAAAMRWLREQLPVDTRDVRVVLRLGPDAAGDLARHRWAGALGLPTDRVMYTRWRDAPARDGVDALIRVPGGAVAASLAGWCDALLAGPAGDDVEDASF